MTLEEARWLRILRVDLGCTWRRVSELFRRATERNSAASPQDDGADLCVRATVLLGEEPWN